jgi:hypothetical protein
MRGRSLDVAERLASLTGCLLRRERVERAVDEEDMREVKKCVEEAWR